MNDLRVKVTGDTAGYDATIARVRTLSNGLATSFKNSVGGAMAGVFSTAAITMAIRKTTEYGGMLTDMSARTGVAEESLQRLDRAAKENGTSLDTLVGFWERLNRARASALKDKGGSDAKAFARLGIGQGDLQSSSPEQLTQKIAAKVAGSKNLDEISDALVEVGGRGVGQLVPLFRAGLDQMYQDMQVMTGEQAAILDELDDKFSTLGQELAILAAGPLVGIINAFRWCQDAAEKFISGMIDGFSKFKQMSTGDKINETIFRITDSTLLGKGINKLLGIKKPEGGIGEAFDKGFMGADVEVKARNAEEAEARAKRAEARKNVPLDFGDAFESDKKKKSSKRDTQLGFDVDALAKVGGYSASSVLVNPALQVAQEQLVQQKEIVRLLKTTNSEKLF